MILTRASSRHRHRRRCRRPFEEGIDGDVRRRRRERRRRGSRSIPRATRERERHQVRSKKFVRRVCSFVANTKTRAVLTERERTRDAWTDVERRSDTAVEPLSLLNVECCAWNAERCRRARRRSRFNARSLASLASAPTPRFHRASSFHRPRRDVENVL